jgi:hypothetical protein
VYTEDELKIVKDIETCLAELTSEFFRGKAKDMLEYFHASKRTILFMQNFNSFTGKTSCKCDIMDYDGEPDCMHSGTFDVNRVSSSSQDFHCLVCGSYNCKDGTCEHKVLHDDCMKISRDGRSFPRYNKHGILVHLRSGRTHTLELDSYMKLDKAKTADENRLLLPLEHQVIEREWRVRMDETQVALDQFKQNRVHEVSVVMAMGQHSRLGEKSSAKCLNPALLTMIMDQYGSS